jgi:hypothetical protein
MQAAVAQGAGAHAVLHANLVAHVTRPGGGFAARRADLGRSCFDGVTIKIYAEHRSTLCRQSQRTGLAYATASACHQHYFVRESLHAYSPCFGPAGCPTAVAWSIHTVRSSKPLQYDWSDAKQLAYFVTTG